MVHKLRRYRKMSRLVPPLRAKARSSPAYISAGHSQSSFPCSRVRSSTLPTRYFQVCAFSFCEVLKKLLGRNHHLDGFAIVHRAVTVGNTIKYDRSIEYSTGRDIPLKNVRQKFLDIRPHRGRPAANRHIIVKGWLRPWDSLLLRNADAAHGATRTSNAN